MRTAQKGLGKTNAPAQAHGARLDQAYAREFFHIHTCAGRPQLADPSATTHPGSDAQRQPAVFGFADTLRERPASGKSAGKGRWAPLPADGPNVRDAARYGWETLSKSTVSPAGGSATVTLVP